MKSKQIAYYLVYGLFWTLGWLPLCILYVLSNILYFIVYYIVRYRKNIVGKNLVLSFPEKNTKDIRRIEQKFYKHFCDILVEIFHMIHISAKSLNRRFKYENIELILELLRQKKNVMIMTSHYGNWEWTFGLPLHTPQNCFPHGIYRQQDNSIINKIVCKIRKRFGGKLIEKNDLLREIFNLNEQNKASCFVMISDQSPTNYNSHCWLTFLNQDTSPFTGTEIIARKFDFPVLYADIIKEKRGHYRCRFSVISRNPKETTKHEISKRYMQLLEETIKNEPAYWLWSHNRWKISIPTDEHMNKDKKVKTAIVILNWNGQNYLKQFLPSIIKNTQFNNTELYIADNGSTDHSIDILKTEFPTAKVITLDKNYGFAGGYNKALGLINADYYVILNSDVEVTPNWLEPLVACLDNSEEVVACQPKILSFSNRNTFEHAGAAGGFIDYIGYPFCRGRVLGVSETDNGQYDTECEVFWATGACLVIKAKAFHAVGGFDSDFFAHMEEIDMCWRLKNRGYKIMCVPQSKIFHVGGGTLTVENPQKTYLNFRNNLLMLYKNLPKNKLFKILFIRWLLDYTAAIQLFMTGNKANAWSVFKARKDYKKMRATFKHKRKDNLLYAKTDLKKDILQKSIIVNYYLKGKKTFNQIIEPK